MFFYTTISTSEFGGMLQQKPEKNTFSSSELLSYLDSF